MNTILLVLALAMRMAWFAGDEMAARSIAASSLSLRRYMSSMMPLEPRM